MTVTVSSVEVGDCDCACRGLEIVTRQHNRLAWPTGIKMGFMFLLNQKAGKACTNGPATVSRPASRHKFSRRAKKRAARGPETLRKKRRKHGCPAMQ